MIFEGLKSIPAFIKREVEFAKALSGKGAAYTYYRDESGGDEVGDAECRAVLTPDGWKIFDSMRTPSGQRRYGKLPGEEIVHESDTKCVVRYVRDLSCEDVESLKNTMHSTHFTSETTTGNTVG